MNDPNAELYAAIDELMAQATPGQRLAVDILTIALDIYSPGSFGLLSGVGRYESLSEKAYECANQSDTLMEFWSRLLQAMGWPCPPLTADGPLIKLWSQPNGAEAIQTIIQRSASLVQIARQQHHRKRGAQPEPSQILA